MASIISWNVLPVFYVVLKDTGDRAWELLRWWRTLPRQVLLYPNLLPKEPSPALCHGNGRNRPD